MKPLDPTRRALLDASNRERTPDAAARARVLASVLAVGAAGAAGSAKAVGAKTAAAGLKGGLGLAHWLLLVGLGAVGSASAYLWLTRAPVPRPPVAVSAAAASVPSNPSPVDSDESLGAARVAPLPPSSAVGAASASTKAPAVAVSPSPSSKSGSVDSLERELSLLKSAHAAYRAGQAGKALSLAREHARRYPHSQLAAERQTIEVLSLCALGRTSEARVVAGNLRAASGSPSLAGLDASCVGK